MLNIYMGGYLASMFWLHSFSKYEDGLFDRVAHRVICDWRKEDIEYKDSYTLAHMNKCKKPKDGLEILKKLNTFTHIIMGPPRHSLFRNNKKEQESLFLTKNLNFYTPLIALNNGESCYAHSIVFGRLITALGYKWRNFSMYYNGKNHNVSEVFYKGRWIVFDPLFNQYFVNPDGSLATKEQIHQNWSYFKKQIGKHLLFKDDPEYKYDFDYNYTPIASNHNKFKIFIKQIVAKILGFSNVNEFISAVSLNRFYYWELKLTFYLLLITAFILILLFGLSLYMRRLNVKK